MGINFRILSLVIFLLAPVLPGSAAEIPMWEGVSKSQKMLDADAAFTAAALEIFKNDKLAAARGLVTKGFIALDQKDPEDAIRRFNQAWLIEPAEPAIYWGFGLALHLRGDAPAQVERFFAMAEKSLPDDPRLMTDHGRILEERGEYQKAREKFENALARAPGLEAAIIGMVRVSVFSGDAATAERYRKILSQIQQ